MNKSLVGILSGLGAASIWGGMYVVSKVVLEIIPPFALVSLRLILGIISLAFIFLLSSFISKGKRKEERISTRQFWLVFAVGFIGYGVSLGFQFVGTKLSTAGNGALVTSATPAFVLIFAALILKEKVTWRKLIALIVASLGVLAVIDPRNAELSSDLFWGNMALIAAAITWALYSVLIGKVTKSLDVLRTSLFAFMGGLVVSVPFGFYELQTQPLGEITLGTIGGILFLGIIATALAMYLWNSAFAVLDAGAASLTFFAQPVVGTLLGWYFLNETITPLFILGGVMIGIGILIANE